MLILVRHGRTVANATGLLQGRVDNPLDAEGEAQAAAVARMLAPVVAGGARVVSSPLVRAQQTAAAFGLPVSVDAAWIELDYGQWDGRPVGDVSREEWAAWRADDRFVPPGGESLFALGTRVRAACDALREEVRDRDVIVVCHVSPIKAAIAWALGVGDAISWRMRVDQASVHRIAIGPNGPSLVSFNESVPISR
jgi:broad specificity phosphatase PhoE